MPALLKKRTGEKHAIVFRNVKVGVPLPTDLDSGSMPSEASLAAAGGHKDISGHVVYAVVQALPPPDHPVCIDTDVVRKIGVDVGVKVVEIHGAGSGVGENTKVVADREQRVEGSQIVIVGIVVAAGHVRAKANTRPRGQARQCHTKL